MFTFACGTGLQTYKKVKKFSEKEVADPPMSASSDDGGDGGGLRVGVLEGSPDPRVCLLEFPSAMCLGEDRE